MPGACGWILICSSEREGAETGSLAPKLAEPIRFPKAAARFLGGRRFRALLSLFEARYERDSRSTSGSADYGGLATGCASGS